MPVTRAQTVPIGRDASGRDRGRLAPEAAASLTRVDAAIGRPLDVNSAWRDPVLQDQMYRAWVAFVQGWGPRPNHGRALPSSQSIHCRGFAVDTDDHALVKTLNKHGWFRTAPDEAWHFEYDRTRDQHLGQTAGTTTKPLATPSILEDETMFLKAKDDTLIRGTVPVIRKGYALAWAPGAGPLKVLSSAEWDLLEAQGAKAVSVDRSVLEKIIRSNGLAETKDYEPGGIPTGRIRYSVTETAYPVVQDPRAS